MAKKESMEVAAPANTAVSVADFERFAGQGQEGAEATDYAIPYLQLLQKLSPHIDDVVGAKAGMFIDTSSNQLFNTEGEGLSVVPCYFKKDMVEWKPRESGGGIVKAHGWNDALMATTKKDERGRMVLPNGNLLVDTKYHYVIIPINDVFLKAVISMTSTQLKRSRKWMTMMQMKAMKRADGSTFIAPSFAYSYLLKSVKEENEKGSWFSWNIESGPQVEDKETIRQAIAFYKAIHAGEVKLNDPDAEAKAAEDDIPF